MNRPYSDWLRIDLHIHTDWSRRTKENDYSGQFSVTTLKQKLHENEVGIFSLTDHNIVNIEAYKEYYENYDDSTDPLLLVGVELDISVNVTREKTYHSLLIFNYSTTDKAQEIHDKLEAKYTEKTLPEKERVLTINEVVELFPNDDFFFIPHAGNTNGIQDGYRGGIEDAQEMVLLMQSAFEKVPEKAQQKYNEGFDSRLIEAFRNKENYAYLRFSDNHKIEDYPCSNKGDDGKQHSFYYVKGGRNFETLRLAFIDPKSRIKSNEDHEDIRTSPRYLDSLNIEGLDGFEDNHLMFSPHLNVVIGGRSSGKSLLMFLLGKKIDSISEKAIGYDNIDLGRVLVKAGQDAELCSETSIPSENITYIQQGDIVGYFEKGDLRQLAKYTGNLDAHKDAKDSIAGHKDDLDSVIGAVVNSYSRCTETAGRRYVLHQATIDSLLSDSFTFIMDADQLRSSFDLSNEIGEAIERVNTIESSLQDFRSDDLYDFTDEETDQIDNFLGLIRSKKELVTGKKNANTRKTIFLTSIEDLVHETNNSLDNEARLKAEARQSSHLLVSDIGNEFSRHAELKNAASSLEAFNREAMREFEIDEGVSLVLVAKQEAQEGIKELVLDGLRDVDVNLSIYRNIVKLLRGDVVIKHYPNTEPETLSRKIHSQLRGVYDSFARPVEYLKYSDGDNSKDKSPGYNSEKYLKIVLTSESSELVFIDQPEDNLGNLFITETLVDLVRDFKFKKQVFLITHNPSVVVHGDAENVIIASNLDNTIRYKQVVIEDESSQKEICKILDGGEYVFDKRSQKYNIKKLIREYKNE